MSDFVIATNDQLLVTMLPPVVVPMLSAPVPLLGRGSTVLFGMRAVCLQGDELPSSLRGVPLPYTSPPFVTPGTGTLTLLLSPANLSVSTLNGASLLLKGGTFQAVFTVQSPAIQPTPAGPVPDPVLSKPGTAQFVVTAVSLRAG